MALASATSVVHNVGRRRYCRCRYSATPSVSRHTTTGEHRHLTRRTGARAGPHLMASCIADPSGLRYVSFAVPKTRTSTGGSRGRAWTVADLVCRTRHALSANQMSRPSVSPIDHPIVCVPSATPPRLAVGGVVAEVWPWPLASSRFPEVVSRGQPPACHLPSFIAVAREHSQERIIDRSVATGGRPECIPGAQTGALGMHARLWRVRTAAAL